jgi:dethiobiotin synthetase
MSDTMSKKQFIISGIGTDVGKTVASAIISQALNATYWKPVQAGDLDWSDSMKVDNWTDDKVIVLKEQFRLTAPMSPHAAAFLDGVSITQDSFVIPQVEGNLIIEGAGGLMVPVNNEGLLYIDLFQSWNLPVILISRHYLGSINHTLLSIGALKSRNIPIEGIVFVGEENKATESIILNTTGVHFIARIPLANEVNSTFIQDQSEVFKEYFQS